MSDASHAFAKVTVDNALIDIPAVPKDVYREIREAAIDFVEGSRKHYAEAAKKTDVKPGAGLDRALYDIMIAEVLAATKIAAAASKVAIDALSARVADLERRQPVQNDRGAYDKRQTYDVGDLVSDDGADWFCVQRTRTQPGKTKCWVRTIGRAAA